MWCPAGISSEPSSVLVIYCTGFPLFSKYQITDFLKVFGPKFQVLSRFLSYTVQGSHFLSNTKLQVFSRFSVLNSRFYQVFLCQIPGTFIQILVIKILNVLKQMQGSHFSCDTKFHVFPGKINEIQGQFGFESVFVLIM